MQKALLVGINLYPDAPLHGCINDVTDMGDFLVESADFDPDHVRLLVDKRATTQNILDRLAWLVADAKPQDQLVFHFSGHGVQLPARNKKGEVDGLDEAICPVNFDWEDNVIRDDDFLRIFSALPAGVQLVWISDSCHSGELSRDLLPPRVKAKVMLPPPDIAWRFRSIEKKGIVSSRAAIGKTTPLPGVLISGCKANQTSADAYFGDRPNGALTYHLLRTLSAPHGMKESASTVVKSVRAGLKRGGYSQVPQLEGDAKRFTQPLFG